MAETWDYWRKLTKALDEDAKKLMALLQQPEDDTLAIPKFLDRRKPKPKETQP